MFVVTLFVAAHLAIAKFNLELAAILLVAVSTPTTLVVLVAYRVVARELAIVYFLIVALAVLVLTSTPALWAASSGG